MEVKLCGMTRAADAFRALELGADYVGVVLAPGPRGATLDVAVELAREAPHRVVLVFRNRPLDDIAAALDATGARWVQLHGHEPPALVSALRERVPGVRAIKAIEVRAEDTAESAAVSRRAWAGSALSRVLLDHPKDRAGGSSAQFAAALAVWRGTGRAVWRAGALTAGALASVAAEGGYAGVDAARGVESAPGVKDERLMREFIAAAKAL